MIRCIFTVFFLSIGCLSIAQVTLQQQQGSKTTTLKAGGEVILDMQLPGPSFSSSARQVSGVLVGEKLGLIQISWQAEQKEYSITTGMQKSETIDYTNISDLPPTSFSIAEVNAIHYRGANAEKWEKIGKVLTFVGLANALVVAPLISADFGNDQFNSQRYGTYAGVSLGLSGVGLTIMLSNRYKTYPMQAAGRKKPNEPLWQL